MTVCGTNATVLLAEDTSYSPAQRRIRAPHETKRARDHNDVETHHTKRRLRKNERDSPRFPSAE